MSEFKVPLTTIKEILPHDNADSLELAKCYDFEIVVRKNMYKVGDPVIFIPPDSILPQELENKIFGADSKIKLNKHRVRQIKIRGKYSQGMLINPNEFNFDLMLEKDYQVELGITKYEPPAARYQGANTSVQKRDKPKENPYFHKYGGIDNFKWYPDLFEEGEMVSITEKVHGSNIRFGYVPYVANSLWRKLLKFLKLTPQWEWVYGSNNVQLQQRTGYKGYYGEDVYGAVLKKYNAKDKVKEGEIWYGELYGDGIQKGYNYGCKNGEHKLVIFDLKLQNGTDTKFVTPAELWELASLRGFDTVPELYYGPFNREAVKELTKGDSVFVPEQKVREGVVIKPIEEKTCSIGRKLLKLISEKYLETDQTEFH